MKTIVLLCALATIAAAVPTNHHETLREQELALEHLPGTLQRERKSPLHDHHDAGQATEDGSEDIHTQLTSTLGHKSSPMEGRSLGFKKPIIVKKKIGYHVYRDSDEEMAHADPHENCSKQVKVKLCDDEPGSPKSVGACFTSERLHENISDKEIENSIKKAKEAVEHLQRGYHKKEHDSGKLAKTEDKELEDDLAVHQHIEAARKALEHVQRNFGNHESLLNLHESSSKIGDFPSKSNDEERLAQWKEAIDNIQKNFEIARNIEDAFKADSEQINLKSTHTDTSSKLRESEQIESNHDSRHEAIPASLSNMELPLSESGSLTKQRENSDVDMFTAPSEQVELKTKLHSDSLKSETISEEPLSDQATKALNTEKTKEHEPTMKHSEITQIIDESLKTSDGIEADHHNNQQLKAANENIKNIGSNSHVMDQKLEKSDASGIEDSSLLEEGKVAANNQDLEKSAHDENIDKTTKHNENDMSMAASHISQHLSSFEMKHSLETESGTSTLEKDTNTVQTALSEERPIDQSLKSKSVSIEDDLHKEKQMESVNHNHKFHERVNPGVSTSEQTNLKHIEPAPVTGTRFTNGQQNVHENIMRMIEDENMEHKTDEMHKLNEQSVTDLPMNEEQKLREFFMRWANENQQRAQESPLTLLEDFSTPTKMSEFSNGEHFEGVHPSMRLSQDHISEHHLSENHEQDLSHQSTHWAHESQQNPSQVAKTANEFHEAMNWNQRQNMQNQVTDDPNLHNLFLMRLAQEKQHNEHLQPDFHKEHFHEISSQNRFTNNLANPNDMSLGPRMNEHMHIMKHAMPSDMDSSMQPSMHMAMRESMGKPTMEHNDIHFNPHHHHHAMARYGSGLPVSGGISSASSGAVGLFPNANPGGCGIPLMLSCSPNVVSGTLAKAQSHAGAITAPAYRAGDDLMYYIKRDAKHNDELPSLKIQKTSLPFNHKPEFIYDKTQ